MFLMCYEISEFESFIIWNLFYWNYVRGDEFCFCLMVRVYDKTLYHLANDSVLVTPYGRFTDMRHICGAT